MFLYCTITEHLKIKMVLYLEGKVKKMYEKKETDEKVTAVSHGKQKNNKKIKSNTIKEMK